MTNGNNILTSFGRFQVFVYATDVGMPISGAVVRITSYDNQQNILAELITDTSGQTEIIDLAAPPLEFSLIPESEKPYSEYNVNILAQGFTPAIIEYVQILPDTLSYLRVKLLPDLTNSMPVESISIAPHTLYFPYPPKIPEDAVKELPEADEFVVLPNVVVPEFIIVHDGVPTNYSAPNYWIPFKDYIKNVASSEIYSTWPESSIRANVLAILSFTLNRVYTEWYRNQGFPFTITSSTAFDQKFIYGRNFYESISLVVDEIFTTFITKPDIRQPLFTQYCNGTTSVCPGWLSQWGSKDLGEQGYTALEILRYYYGQEIFLMTAERVEGVPISYPGTPLQVGSSGPDVRAIQTQLNAISNNFPAIPKVRVDGIYGDQVRQAVEIFQGVFDLPVTGIVDFATWYQISNIYVAVTKMAEL